MLHNTSVKAGLSAAAVISAVLIPAAGSASAASAAPAVSGKTVTAAADSFDAKCRSHSRNYVLKKYYRQVPVGPPTFYTLRCGTSTWGWKHIKAGHGWDSTMDRKIGAAIGSGDANGRGGYSTYANQCPRVEKFRTIIGTPAARNDLLTAYKVDQPAAAGAARC
ncbi:hypothetical protein [Streptomyces mirabilis]|jgi:hypothetical protein|uniref:hypothetical protein n=1 Tax=Streptomyces mirabilis TaxID=68239 RepID=UPI000F297CEC|nr:hypothetical protein [Streptomyces mirabilis]MCX4431257.1 hypothetical protein [Streptomyces mirabilis]